MGGDPITLSATSASITHYDDPTTFTKNYSFFHADTDPQTGTASLLTQTHYDNNGNPDFKVACSRDGTLRINYVYLKNPDGTGKEYKIQSSQLTERVLSQWDKGINNSRGERIFSNDDYDNFTTTLSDATGTARKLGEYVGFAPDQHFKDRNELSVENKIGNKTYDISQQDAPADAPGNKELEIIVREGNKEPLHIIAHDDKDGQIDAYEEYGNKERLLVDKTLAGRMATVFNNAVAAKAITNKDLVTLGDMAQEALDEAQGKAPNSAPRPQLSAIERPRK